MSFEGKLVLFLRESLIFCKRYAPEILSVAACGGVVVTGYLSAKAGHRLGRQEAYSEYDDEYAMPTKKEKLKAYAAPVTAGLVTIGLISGAALTNRAVRSTLEGAVVAAATRFNALQAEYEAYEDAVVREIPDFCSENMIPDKLYFKNSKLDSKYYLTEIDTEDEEPALFFDNVSGAQFEAKPTRVLMAEQEICRKYVQQNYISLAEYKEMLGLDHMIEPDDVYKAFEFDPECDILWLQFVHNTEDIECGDGDALQCCVIDVDHKVTNMLWD